MKQKNKLSVFALQQRLNRPIMTIVMLVFTLGYLLYLVILLTINAKKGWFTTLEYRTTSGTMYENEIYNLGYFFQSFKSGFKDYPINFSNSTTPFLIRSEIIFFFSLIAVVVALTVANVKMNRNSYMLKRLSISSGSTKTIRCLSDCINIALMWFLHVGVIVIFSIIYSHFAPLELKDPQNLYRLFASERYLYLLFPVLNPISLIRMITLIIGISPLPYYISRIFNEKKDEGVSIGSIVVSVILIGLFCWCYFAKGHVMSLVICIITGCAGILLHLYRIYGEDYESDELKYSLYEITDEEG